MVSKAAVIKIIWTAVVLCHPVWIKKCLLPESHWAVNFV